MANSADPDQMLHSAISDVSTLFAQACLAEYLGLKNPPKGVASWIW